MPQENRESPMVELFMEKGNDFVLTSPEETVGSLINLVKNSFEPILVSKGDTVLGLISVQNLTANSRLAKDGKADNNLVKAALITPQAQVNTAIRLMIDYGWLRLPVVNDKQKLIGQVRTRTILKALINNKLFLKFLRLKLRFKKPIVLTEKAKVQDAYRMLKNKKQSRIFLVDGNGKYKGTVSKISLIKAFNKMVESKRFSLKPGGSPAHNIYVGEKIDRDDYYLISYYKRKRYGLTGRADDKKTDLIKRLVNSSYNSLTIVDNNGLPTAIVSLKDLLTAAMVKDEGGDLKLILRGFEGVKKTDLRTVVRLITRLANTLNKTGGIIKIELSNNEVKNVDGKVLNNELTLKVELSGRKSYLSHQNSENVMEATREMVQDIKRQVLN